MQPSKRRSGAKRTDSTRGSDLDPSREMEGKGWSSGGGEWEA